MDDLKTNNALPHLVSIGSPYDTANFYIVAGGSAVLKIDNFVDGVILLVIMYFVLWFEYPAKCKCTYAMLQEKILEQPVSKPLPKLIRFIEKLAA